VLEQSFGGFQGLQIKKSVFDILSRKQLLAIAIETYLCRIELVRRSRFDFGSQGGRFRGHVEVYYVVVGDRSALICISKINF
jgi:hypothetical protein